MPTYYMNVPQAYSAATYSEVQLVQNSCKISNQQEFQKQAELQVSKQNGIFSESHKTEWEVLQENGKCLQRMGSGRKEWFEVII